MKRLGISLVVMASLGVISGCMEGQDSESVLSTSSSSNSTKETNGQVSDGLTINEINEEFSDISQKFSSSIIDINELINELENKFNPEDYVEIDFDEIDEKIYQYQQLSKFFEVEPESLFSIKDEILKEIDTLENFDKERKTLFDKYTNDLNNFKKEALKVSNLRKKESKKISENINKQLPIVNIEQGELIFKFSEKEEKDYTSQGYDELNVLFRTNKNSEFSTIKKVASGGELSRLLLIIKSLSANNDNNLTLIFDEVDSGLSGQIASNVSEKIKNISRKNQVIAITHSAQVASKAHKHWKIEKIIKNDQMTSQIIELNDESRIDEIANLISGTKISETARKVALDLLQN